MAKRTRKSHDASPESSRGKGDILEAIVEEIHSVAGLTVERNVFLPSVSDPDREREIDVLITGNMAGYLVRGSCWFLSEALCMHLERNLRIDVLSLLSTQFRSKLRFWWVKIASR